ncbi:MAG: LegC family aminotransferase [Acidaminobacteraceae bacterium]
MGKVIGLSTPNLHMDIVENLKECIETGWVSTGGRFITEFEGKMAKYVKVKDAIGVQSGTGGLHVSLEILGVKAGDEVIAPTLTFIAAVNPITYLGAQPLFMDCDDSLNMDLDKLQEFCEEECYMHGGELYSKASDNRIPVIVVVHVFGNPVDMERLMNIAKKYNLKVLEDATEALGSYYTSGVNAGKHCGTIGDMGVYSFNANKIITTGGGGMIVSDNEEYIKKARFLSVQAKTDSLYFIHDEIGYNYRMTNLQAALGTDQIDRLESFIDHKIKMYNKYKEALKDIDGLYLVEFNDDTRSNHWFYSIVVDKYVYGMDKDELLIKLNEAGIQTRPLWRLIHKNKPYVNHNAYNIEKAYFYEENILNVPCSTNLSDEDFETVVGKLREFKK